ncbi:MAG: phosphoribosylamine--glycine ligase [Cyanobacteria bacterium]|nr:phosphoribosylamine--glycine ligase [Cyanobacteriota bacterium]
MKILVVGSGGREHALAWKLSQSPRSPELFFAPGNPGMVPLGQRLDIDPTDLQGLAIFAQREKIDLTVVGPEAPLALGLVDLFHAKGLGVFGPTQQAAQMETSKDFAKKIMDLAHVPTARHILCRDWNTAEKALKDFKPPYVIKQDGLAAGKGVTVTPNLEEAYQAIQSILDLGSPVLIEDFLSGQELSVLAVCDGTRGLMMLPAQDHKRLLDGNQGPNTGGMGAYAPVPFVTPELMQLIQKQVFDPILKTLKAQGTPYQGVLYAGLMISPEGKPWVIEFNARFGDPETQVILPLMKTDLVDLLMAAAQGDLSSFEKTGIEFQDNQFAVTVAMVSGGYPGAFEKGYPITFPKALPQDVFIFHAGTALGPRMLIPPGIPSEFTTPQVVTQGGRVLNVTGLGNRLLEAQQNAYQGVSAIQFEKAFYRQDIAASALS